MLSDDAVIFNATQTDKERIVNPSNVIPHVITLSLFQRVSKLFIL